MSDISVRGYVKRPTTKTGQRGPYSTFTLSEKVKDPKAEKGFRYAFYSVTDFNNAEPPPDGAYVTVGGYLKPREYEKDGVKRLSLDVVAQKLDISPPRDGGHVNTDNAPSTQKDPWDL